jgi:hypothetical protein
LIPKIKRNKAEKGFYIYGRRTEAFVSYKSAFLLPAMYTIICCLEVAVCIVRSIRRK